MFTNSECCHGAAFAPITGKPYEGKLHVRFDEGVVETGNGCPSEAPFNRKGRETDMVNLRTRRHRSTLLARNVLAKVPMKLKQTVADDIRTIFYASSKKKAMEYFDRFRDKLGKEVPSATRCLERSIEKCLTFFHYPQEEWICLRTTNIIERLNKEFKRRTKPMEIVAGERACYTLLVFICLKMELHWRKFLIGKRASNLPLLQNLEQTNFTQSS